MIQASKADGECYDCGKDSSTAACDSLSRCPHDARHRRSAHENTQPAFRHRSRGRDRRRELTSEALVAACLERIRAREPEVQAWAHIDPDGALQAGARARPRSAALAAARHSRRREGRDRHRRPADRVRLADLQGQPPGVRRRVRRAGARARRRHPRQDGDHRVRDAPSRARRAIRATSAHTPGGSSSGSAAAVADGMVPIAFGTQTSSSIIRPAAFCGVVGYKPTFNR